jgi:hypothetical protein
VALYFLYRYFWKKARRLRAERDLLRLPLRHFPQDQASGEERGVALVTGETYLMSSNPNLKPKGEPTLRTCSVRGRRSGPEWLFGALDSSEPEGRVLRVPQDPLAELVRVPGDPVQLAQRSNRLAHALELAAAACFGLGTGGNLFLILLLLRLTLR